MTDMRLRIIHDTDVFCPRENFDNLGTMACWHRRSNLGDEQIATDNWESAEDWLEECVAKGAVVLSLYLYEHGGMTMSTGPFSCVFDSGQVGFIYCEPDTIKKEYSVEEITDDIRKLVEEVLKGEVTLYDHYLMGNTWGYVLEKVRVCGECDTTHYDHEDSCFGFYGDTLDYTGIAHHITDEHKHLLEAAWDDRGEA